MVVGSGLIASAFSAEFALASHVCIYAAGVSNSACVDSSEFVRESTRLEACLRQNEPMQRLFVYFGSCSVGDPEARGTPYVEHKLSMERMVTTQSRYLILRLPQVAGLTPNPHTLLNFLYSRIIRAEIITVWRNANRNIIDIDDIAKLTRAAISANALHNRTVNLANPVSYSMLQIVAAFEELLQKPAVINLIERGSHYLIDTTHMSSILDRTDVHFGRDYLISVLGKYYGRD